MKKSKQWLPFYKVGVGFCFLYCFLCCCIIQAVNASVGPDQEGGGKVMFS